jgi:enoyl-CoA hydratase
MASYDNYEFMEVKVDDGIAMVSFNRPEKLNAMRESDHEELPKLLHQLQTDDDVRVGVVSGNGRAFSVGGDHNFLADVGSNNDALHSMMANGRDMVHAHVAMNKPMIAAVHGWALGAGLAFALLCDFIYVDRGTQLSDGHIRGGITAGDVGVLMWPTTVGMAKAKRYLMTGDWLDADEAERIGLITEVVDPGTALTHATVMAKRLASGPQHAIRYTKMALNQWLRAGLVTAFDYSTALEMLTFRSSEFEGYVQGLREKRPAILGPEAFLPRQDMETA